VITISGSHLSIIHLMLSFLRFNIVGFFFAFRIRLFFEVSTLATILSNKHFFSMAVIFLTSIVGYSNPHQIYLILNKVKLG
jgi:hypothetical protein